MKAISRFLRESYIAPADPSLPVRSWWGTVPADDGTNWRRSLQRMIVSCFDDRALAHALAAGGGKDPAKTYERLYLGLLSKTHYMGAAAPQHFDVMFSVLRWMCAPGMTSEEDLKTIFGDLSNPVDERLRRYSRKMGNMCSGMAGTFARYATASGRPGATVKPIPVIAASAKERDKSTPIPERWNLAGLEDAAQFGNGGSEHPALVRERVADVKPGDYIVHDNTGLETFNHVAIIDTVKHDGDKAFISTVESCSDSGTEGMVYTENVELTGGDGKFKYFRLNKAHRACFVRRINHWAAGERHDLTDVMDP